jgi:FimV-like protein
MKPQTILFRAPLLALLAALALTGPASAADEPYLYGPIRSGEHLSRIAYALRPDKTRLGTWQMAAALYRNNPRAFVRDDIALLQPGKMLLVPSDQEVRSIDPALAQQLSSRPDLARKLLRSQGIPSAATTAPPPLPAATSVPSP